MRSLTSEANCQKTKIRGDTRAVPVKATAGGVEHSGGTGGARSSSAGRGGAGGGDGRQPTAKPQEPPHGYQEAAGASREGRETLTVG